MARFLLILFGCVGCSFAEPEVILKGGIRYFVVKAEAEKVRVLWKDDGGKQLRDFPAANAYIEGKRAKPLMLMNGGIFEPGGIPSGVIVQEGKALLPVNRKDGRGNFFLKPNGVFLISDKGARVMETGKYPPAGERILYAVQSGPLLLVNGKTHPAFKAGSDSRLLRNGVGVTEKGIVVFAISDAKGDKWPNLYEFADLFRSLGCRNALFLDGDISQMRTGGDMQRRSNRFGSIIAAVK